MKLSDLSPKKRLKLAKSKVEDCTYLLGELVFLRDNLREISSDIILEQIPKGAVVDK